MKQFSLTSPRFEGEFLITYNDSKILVKFEVVDVVDTRVIIHMLKNMPLTIDGLFQFQSDSESLNVTEVVLEITFEMFWKRYDDKIKSSKKRSEKLWSKLSKADQQKAYNHIAIYFKYKGNAEKKYCETYLGAELWNN